MNNNTATSAVISELIQEAYLGYVYTLVDVSTLALLSYTTVLAIPREMEYMWLSPKALSIPNLLYVFTRYGSLIYQALVLWLDFVPAPLTGSLCNHLSDAQVTAFILTYIGVQGLLITRTYALCGGNKIIAGGLAFFFAGALITCFWGIITSECTQGNVNDNTVLQATLIQDICIISTDLLAFCVCVWKVWGTWRLKREVGIQNRNDLVWVLLKQTVFRFCFVIVFTITFTILNKLENSASIGIVGSFQHSLSAILLADFTLDLRERHSAAIQTANVSLPTIQFQSVARYIHESILVEMGDHEDTNTREGGDDELLGSPDVASDSS